MFSSSDFQCREFLATTSVHVRLCTPTLGAQVSAPSAGGWKPMQKTIEFAFLVSFLFRAALLKDRGCTNKCAPQTFENLSAVRGAQNTVHPRPTENAAKSLGFTRKCSFGAVGCTNTCAPRSGVARLLGEQPTAGERVLLWRRFRVRTEGPRLPNGRTRAPWQSGTVFTQRMTCL